MSDKRGSKGLTAEQVIEALRETNGNISLAARRLKVTRAAIAYYVVSLGAYVFKAMKEVGLLPIDPTVATALFVPVSLLGIALTVRVVRKRFER